MAKTETKLNELRINQLSKERFQQALNNGEIVLDEFYMIPEENLDVSQTPVEFTQASTRNNIASNETVSTIFGKISKWFSDLGSLAFKSTVAKTDLESSVQTSLGKADNAVPNTRTVNGKALSSNITLSASDIGARPDTWTPSKSDIGLGNVGNFKAVSTVANQGLTDTEKSNARANIGAGTSTAPNDAQKNVQSDWNATSGDAFIKNKPTNVSAFTNDVNYVKNTDYATDNTAGVIKRGNWITLSSDGELEAGELTKAQYDSASGKTFVGKTTLDNVLNAIIPTVSDTYSSTSSNAMSGKAVSSAISSVTTSSIGAVPTTRKINNKALSSDISLSASDVSAVPTTRKVNNKALSSDITLALSDLSDDSSHRTVKDSEKTAWNGKANKSGDIFTGAITIPQSSVFSTPNNTVIRPSSESVNASAIAGDMIWHDLFAFCKMGEPKYYTTNDGATWNESTLNKTLFAQKGANSTSLLTSTVIGARWVWGGANTAFGWGNGEWLVLGVTYQATVANYTVVFESSADNETWVERHRSTGKWSIASVYFKLSSYGGDRYLRLTITKEADDVGILNMGQIRLLTARYGSQGMGKELEYPYTWDENQNLAFKASSINGVSVPSSPKFTDTTYSSKTASNGGTDVSLVTTGEKYTWNNKSNFSGNYNDLTNKPTIPTTLSSLSGDATHRVVTDAEKAAWNAKSDFSGSYNDLTDKPEKQSSVKILRWI